MLKGSSMIKFHSISVKSDFDTSQIVALMVDTISNILEYILDL